MKILVPIKLVDDYSVKARVKPEDWCVCPPDKRQPESSCCVS